MGIQKIRFILITIVVVLIAPACATEPTPPPVDIAGTIAVQLAAEMLTQTAAAYTPTPPPSPTPLPATATPIPTNTSEPATDSSIIRIEVLDGKPECWSGPDNSFTFISVINGPKTVRLLGIGSLPGWYVIKNPYFGSPCWLPASAVEIDPAVDLSSLPVINPGASIYEIPDYP